MNNALQKISVIIEWKNQNFAAGQRAEAMLRQLNNQWLSLRDTNGKCLEILFIHDNAATRQNLEKLTSEHFNTPSDAFTLRFIDGADLSYYEMKDRGARLANGDILIFLDSDVIPEPTWLLALLTAIKEDQVQIVCGNTYIEPLGLLGKSFALGWFFPLRSEKSGIESRATCYSNNLAVHASLYREFPFIEIHGTSRSATQKLIKRLAKHGITTYKCHDAQVSHPPPENVAHFLLRALVHGRDIYFKTNHNSGYRTGNMQLTGALLEAWKRYTTAMKRIWNHHQQVDLPVLLIPVAMAIMSIYYLLFASGNIDAHIAPVQIAQRLQI